MRGWRNLLLGIGLMIAVAMACQRAASSGMPPTPTFESQVVYLATPQGQMGALEQTPEEPTATPTRPTPVSTPSPPVPPSPTATLAASPTPTPLPTSTPMALKVPAQYVLKEGEFPYCIARRFNIHPADLLRANGLSSGARPRPGTILRIPQNARPWPDTYPRALIPHPTTYVTQAGDTLYKIACKFGDVWPEQIAQANGIPLSQLGQPLEPGKKLKIP